MGEMGWLSHTDTRKYTVGEGHCVGEMGWEWLSHTDTRKYTVGEGHCVGERGRGGCHIQIPENTLLEKVTVWVKGVGVAVTYR